MESLPDDFGYEADENGDVHFLTVHTDYEVTNFEEYMNLFTYMIQLAEQHPNTMPILRFGDGS